MVLSAKYSAKHCIEIGLIVKLNLMHNVDDENKRITYIKLNTILFEIIIPKKYFQLF